MIDSFVNLSTELDHMLVSGRSYIIWVFWKPLVDILFVEYFGCVHPCIIYMLFCAGI